MKTPVLAIAAASLAVTASPALAGDGTNHMTVHHADLDLASKQGVKALESRIDRAARVVCGASTPAVTTLREAAETRRCIAKAKAGSKQHFAAVVEQQRLGG